jgi:DNA repair exonuclease SbcCD ATPase subunit
MEIKLLSNERSLYSKQLIGLQEKIQESLEERGDIQKEREKLKEVAAAALELIERKSELIKEKSLQEVALGLLKETGIKASIVKEYLPLLNKLINDYLTEFDFFVNFELDENFNEVIKSRGRDDYSYYSFSEGEKKRIDIAILMAFRNIASIKNSAKINLLVTDECDGGLDDESLAKFVEIVTTMEETNSWVISHVISGTDLVDEFHAIATVKKRGDFSEITIV